MVGIAQSTNMAADSSLLLAPKISRPGLRRLSSKSITAEDMADGPIVITPEKHIEKPSNAYETAVAMEMAKRHLGILSSGTGTPVISPESTVTDSYAFAFDIDGVLIRGGDPIPEAIEAMKVLNGENEYGIKVYENHLL